jgi:hypothetical protein
MATTAGGFLSRGIKIRGGNQSFAPLEWKHVDTTGDDLRKGIYPLPPGADTFFAAIHKVIKGEKGMTVDHARS